jgi:hypothetical protein
VKVRPPEWLTFTSDFTYTTRAEFKLDRASDTARAHLDGAVGSDGPPAVGTSPRASRCGPSGRGPQIPTVVKLLVLHPSQLDHPLSRQEPRSASQHREPDEHGVAGIPVLFHLPFAGRARRVAKYDTRARRCLGGDSWRPSRRLAARKPCPLVIASCHIVSGIEQWPCARCRRPAAS